MTDDDGDDAKRIRENLERMEREADPKNPEPWKERAQAVLADVENAWWMEHRHGLLQVKIMGQLARIPTILDDRKELAEERDAWRALAKDLAERGDDAIANTDRFKAKVEELEAKRRAGRPEVAADNELDRLAEIQRRMLPFFSKAVRVHEPVHGTPKEARASALALVEVYALTVDDRRAIERLFPDEIGRRTSSGARHREARAESLAYKAAALLLHPEVTPIPSGVRLARRVAMWQKNRDT